MEIRKEIEKFAYKRLNHIYGRAHDAIVGEWIKWWITECLKGRKGTIHSVINPAMRARFWGNTYFADILFAQHSEKIDVGKDIDGEKREFFRVIGVAEIENDNSLEKLEHRVNSLYAYEKCKDKRHRNKFPDLEFGILCTHYSEKDFEERETEIKRIKRCIKEKSVNSKMQWVFYILKKTEIDDDYFFRVTGYARDPARKSFYYGKSFFGKPTYYLFQEGRQLRSRSRPE